MNIFEIILLVAASGIGIYLIITNIEITDLLKGINIQKYLEELEIQKKKYHTKEDRYLEAKNAEIDDLRTRIFRASSVICELVTENHNLREKYDPEFKQISSFESEERAKRLLAGIKVTLKRTYDE